MKIFISYARVNRKQVETLEKLLTDLGHDAWFDREIVAGEDWWKSITASIERCEVFVFALSPQSTNSSACRAEFQYALDLNKPILPVMLLEAELPIGKLRETQFVNGRALNRPETIIEISKALSVLKDNIAGGEYPPPDPLPPRPAFPFPPDPLAEIRQKMQHVEALTEQDMLEIVYQLSATARVGAKTEREALTILQEIARHPRSTLRVAQVAKEAIQLRHGRRTMFMFLGVTLLVVVVVAFAAVMLTNRARNDIENTRQAMLRTSTSTLTVTSDGTQTALSTQVAGLQQQTATLERLIQTLEATAADSPTSTPSVTPTATRVEPSSATSTGTAENVLTPTLQFASLPATGCFLDVTSGGANVRRYPGNTYEVLYSLRSTDRTVPILAYAATSYNVIYYLIVFENEYGWISSGLGNTSLLGTCDRNSNIPFIEVDLPE